MSSSRKDRPLTPEEIRAQMEWMNNPEERKLGEDAFGALNEGTRPVSASSSKALEEKEKEVQKVNDQAIADLIAKDVAEGPSPELNTKQNPLYAYPKTTISQMLQRNSIVALNDPRLKQGPESRLSKKLSNDVAESILFPYLSNRDVANVSTSCISLYSKAYSILKIRKFAKAMLDQDLPTLSSMLETYPTLLFVKFKDYGIKKIQSHYTWLQYFTGDHTLFSAAQLLKLVDVVEVMLPHYLKELQDAQNRGKERRITELENAWVMQVSTIEEQKALQKKYTDELILPVITALAANTTIRVIWANNPETVFSEATIENASEATLTALKELRDKLFEPKALKDCIDVDQLLIAVYNAYDDQYSTFQNWPQRDAYAVLVIGLIQSLVDPKLGKTFSQGLYEVVNNNEQISERAQLLKLADGRPYYRSREASQRGLGFTFLCSIYGGAVKGSGGSLVVPGACLKNYVKQRQQSVSNLRSKYSSIAARRQQSNHCA